MKQLKTAALIVSLLGSSTLALALTDNSTSTTSPATSEQQSTMDDQSLKFKISNQLNDMYPGNNIEVTVFNGQVLLSGQVKTLDVKKAAAGFAQKTEGVKSVLLHDTNLKQK